MSGKAIEIFLEHLGAQIEIETRRECYRAGRERFPLGCDDLDKEVAPIRERYAESLMGEVRERNARALADRMVYGLKETSGAN